MVMSPEAEKRILARIANLVSKYTSSNPIPARQISKELGIEDVGGSPKTREFIERTIAILKTPIGANSNGFFLIADEEELDQYVKSLAGRVKGISRRMVNVRDAFNKWSGLQ